MGTRTKSTKHTKKIWRRKPKSGKKVWRRKPEPEDIVVVTKQLPSKFWDYILSIRSGLMLDELVWAYYNGGVKKADFERIRLDHQCTSTRYDFINLYAHMCYYLDPNCPDYKHSRYIPEIANMITLLLGKFGTYINNLKLSGCSDKQVGNALHETYMSIGDMFEEIYEDEHYEICESEMIKVYKSMHTFSMKDYVSSMRYDIDSDMVPSYIEILLKLKSTYGSDRMILCLKESLRFMVYALSWTGSSCFSKYDVLVFLELIKYRLFEYYDIIFGMYAELPKPVPVSRKPFTSRLISLV